MVLTFVGVVAFMRLPVNLNPDITFPSVHVAVAQPGAAPTELETQVLRKVEGSIASIVGVRHITSWAIEGVANMSVEFQIGTPIDRAVNDVRDAISKVRAELPERPTWAMPLIATKRLVTVLSMNQLSCSGVIEVVPTAK